ncbi:MAG TPA: hypothetical protein DCP55_03735 [Chitinophagaceae bacterium]|nr:hypothetical protein [Chitinophagaceae bacterium]
MGIRAWLIEHKRYISNLGTTFISQGVTALSLLFLTPLLVARLGESEFSMYGVLLNVIVIASIFDLGLNAGLCHRLIQEPERRNLLINAVFFYSPIVFLIGIPVFFFIFYLGWVNISAPAWLLSIVIALAVAQNMLALQFESILQSVNKVYVAKLLRMSKTILEAFLFYLVSYGGQFEWLLLVSVLVNFFFLLFLYLFAKKQLVFKISLSLFNWVALRSQLKYSFWYFQSMLASVVTYNVQIVVMSHYFSSTQMAIFLMVFRFYEVLRLGMTNFAQVLFPSISALQAKGEWALLTKKFKEVWVRVFVLSLVVLVLLIMWGNRVFIWWSGYDSPEGNTLFLSYALYLFLLVVDHVSVIFLLGLRFTKIPAIVSTIQSLLSVVVTIYFIKIWGLPGVVWASLLLFVLTTLVFNPVYLLQKLKERRSH